ncbi:MAG: MarR family transcriptional regulator [Chloroflexi bacterium]|nr:MarR family transcriptional regulator [Chloroflexota bacterium]
MSTLLVDPSPPPAAGSLTSELARVLSRIGRGLRYHTRAEREALDITQSEGELLRLLDRRPGIRVHDAASELGIASNSVSTLVKQLARAGLLERTVDPQDGRAACLRLSPSGSEWVTQLGNAREQTIDHALASLDLTDREQLEAAIPAMKRLAKAISKSYPGGSMQ